MRYIKQFTGWSEKQIIEIFKSFYFVWILDEFLLYRQSWPFVGIPHPIKNHDPMDKKSPGYPEKVNPGPGDFGVSEFFTQDFQFSIPIPGISGFSGFFDLARKKIPIPNPRDRDSGSRKNPIPEPTLLYRNQSDNRRCCQKIKIMKELWF